MVDKLRSEFGASVCAPNAPVDQSVGPPLNHDFSGSVAALARTSDVAVLGDTDHEKLGTRWFADHGVVDTLAKSGVKTLYLEMDPAEQAKIDAFTAGKMSAADFTKEVSSHYVGDETALTDLIAQARKNGMKVIAADNPKAGEAAQMAGRYNLMAEVSGTDTPEGQQSLETSRNYLKERMGYDVDLAHKINETRGNEKAAVIFGANHGRTENGLMANLRGSAVKMDIYGNSLEEQKDRLEEDRAIGALARKPDAVYVESRNTVFATCNTPPQVAQNLEQKPQNQMVAENDLKASPAMKTSTSATAPTI
jgi:hypothetical protein